MKLRELFLREADEVYIVIVRDNGEIIRIPGIPASVLQAEDFEEKLQRLIDRDYPQGNITVRGNWTIVNNDGIEIDIRALNPDPDPEGEIPPEDEIADPGETAPEPEEEPEPEPKEVELDTFEPETAEEEPSDPDRVSVTLIDGRIADFKDWQRDQDEPISELAVVETGPEEGALIDRETMEIVGAVRGTEFAQTYQDAVDAALEQIEATGQSAIMPDNYVGVIGPESAAPAQGGGADGDTGDEGVEGEEGAVTGEQRAEIPSIIEELYRSISGLGTNETRMINALKRIKSPAHLEAVVQMYREEYNSSLPSDIIQEFRFEGGNTTQVIEEINQIMRPLGWELVGSQWFNLRWKKDQSENTGGSSSTSTSEESTFQPTNEEREQMADAKYVYDAVMSQVDQQAGYWTEVEPIEYTDADGKISFIRNPVQFFDLPTDREYSAADLQDIKDKIGDLFPLISGARLPNPENEEGGPLAITIGTGQFAYTRELEDEE